MSENGSCVPQRMKYWEECATEEKLERAREATHHLKDRVDQLTALVAKLVVHQHNCNNGELLTPLTRGDVDEARPFKDRRDNKEVYF